MEKIYKIIKSLIKKLLGILFEIIKTVGTFLLIFIFIFICSYFYMKSVAHPNENMWTSPSLFSNKSVENHGLDETVVMINKDILIKSSEISEVIFSQSMFYSFNGNGDRIIVVELTDEGLDRILLDKKTKIGVFDYINIGTIPDIKDYNNQNIVINFSEDYFKEKFYYISNESTQEINSEKNQDDWITKIYINENDNRLYYFTYRT